MLACSLGGSVGSGRLRGSDGPDRACLARLGSACDCVCLECVCVGRSPLKGRLGIVVVREFARHRYRQSQLVGLTREQLTAIARDAQRQRAGATRGEELAALVVELAQQRVVPAAERHGGLGFP